MDQSDGLFHGRGRGLFPYRDETHYSHPNKTQTATEHDKQDLWQWLYIRIQVLVQPTAYINSLDDCMVAYTIY